MSAFRPDGTYFEDPDGSRHYPDDGDGAVDIPALKYGPPDGGAPGKGPSGGIGEPHYLTEDGASITTQRLGVRATRTCRNSPPEGPVGAGGLGSGPAPPALSSRPGWVPPGQGRGRRRCCGG